MNWSIERKLPLFVTILLLAVAIAQLETAGRRGVVRDPLHRDEGARAIRRLA